MQGRGFEFVLYCHTQHVRLDREGHRLAQAKQAGGEGGGRK